MKSKKKTYKDIFKIKVMTEYSNVLLVKVNVCIFIEIW